jgi:hypothetical protein
MAKRVWRLRWARRWTWRFGMASKVWWTLSKEVMETRIEAVGKLFRILTASAGISAAGLEKLD